MIKTLTLLLLIVCGTTVIYGGEECAIIPAKSPVYEFLMFNRNCTDNQFAKTINALVAAGESFNLPEFSCKKTALMYLIEKKQDFSTIVEALKSADDTVTDEYGRTIKHYACKFGSSAVIEAVYAACSKKSGQTQSSTK